MGLLHKQGRSRSHTLKTNKRWRTCRFEQMEPRQFLSAAPLPIDVGAVYYESHDGTHSDGNLFYVTFDGGAPGTQLDRVVIDLDKTHSGQTAGNPFFNTAPGGPGVYGSMPPTIVEQTGIGTVNFNVQNGGTLMTIDFTGFQAGGKLVFRVGVNDMKADGTVDALVDGAEFQGSHVTADFSAQHYYAVEQTGMALDAYDSTMAGMGLDLPPDSYMPPDTTPQPVYTAGIGMSAVQTPLPISIAGTVFEDVNLDNKQETGEPGIGGVQLALYSLEGSDYVATGATTVTDAAGNYKFSNVLPGTYRVVESQPPGYFSVGAAAGTVGGTIDGTVTSADIISQITLQGGDDSVQNNFAEALPASVSGRVFADLNGNYTYDSGEPLLQGVTIQLLDPSGTVLQTTQTDANGEYAFNGLQPGTYGLHEIQPAGYFDGPDSIGSAGGTLVPPDSMSGIRLLSAADGVHYDFCEIPPASLSGYVYVDDNNNGIFDKGETPIPGVTVTLIDSSGLSPNQTAVTDANGYYHFENLMPGTYSVSETQPVGYYEGQNTAGSAGGVAHNPGDLISGVKLNPAVVATDYDFGELRPASISGRVFADLNGDYLYESGEPLLAGVTVNLINASGQQVATTATDDKGDYSFLSIQPGVYSVQDVQPAGYLAGGDFVGTAGGRLDGVNRIADIPLGSGVNGERYDFCELLPATISGYVFQDGPTIQVKTGDPIPDIPSIRDGQLTADDTRLGGIVMTLGDGSGVPMRDAGGNPITTVTDADGYYQFTMLPPGVYTVIESHPAGYIDGVAKAGTKGGLVVNQWEKIDASILSTLAVDPSQNAIVQIPINPGDVAVQYNFSEVRVEQTPPTPPPTPPGPPGMPPVPMPLLAPPLAAPVGQPPAPAVVAAYYVAAVPPPAPWIFGGGGGGSVDSAWHLSVINGGQPRREDGGLEVASNMGNASFDPVSWTGVDLTQSQWVLANADGVPVRTIVFGMPGARPVIGDFNGDGKSEVGVYINGQWFIDLNGDGVWDEGDLRVKLGGPGDLPITGDWDGDGKTDIGIFGPAWPGDPRALLIEPGLPDANNAPSGRHKNLPPDPADATDGYRTMKRTATAKVRTDVIDHVFEFGNPGDIPVVGDWNGDGVYTIGVFRDGMWLLDMDGDGKWSPGDVMCEFGQRGDVPVVGDWTGDGSTKIGVYRAGKWYLDVNNNHVLDAHDKVIELGGPNDVPVVGDWNGDGVDKPGLYQDHAPQPAPQTARSAAPATR